MAYKKLQLNLLTQTGELVNCVSCFPGQVSVFRAPSYAALEVYQRALAGVPGPERIAIFLDDQSFIPTEHFFVGFGEQRESAHETVLSSFSRIGIDERIFNTLCHSYGIEIDESTRWSALTKCEARRVRLLLATQTRAQVIILNDPFEPLANQWRERFAELVAQFARHNKEIVLVTNLSSRPEAWIDNHAIARIQVGEEIQRTIGFGTQQSAGNELIQQLRSSMKEPARTAPVVHSLTNPVKQHEEEVEEEHESRDEYQPTLGAAFHSSILTGLCTVLDTLRIPYNDAKLQQRYALIQSSLSSPIISGSLAATLMIGAGAYLFSSSTTDQAPVVVATLQQEQESPSSQQASAVPNLADNPENSDDSNELRAARKLNPPPSEPPDVKVQKALDEYPDSIKNSVLASFQGLATELGAEVGERKKPSVPAPAKEEETSDLLRLLATASDSGEGLPDAPPPSDTYVDNSYQNNSVNQAPQQFGSEEEKREAIRKRFLEAIERAQSMRKQG